MLKDTKSLGNNKAPACESRGFVLKKKEGAHFILTHPHGFIETTVFAENKVLMKIWNKDHNPILFSFGCNDV
ncbi:hypothetical protein [Bacteroides sp.]|uniref:hypothetical protein n=1 Tax=Bacteroides sp. TaxID=29523 RepID=UPI0023D1F4CC|nr:hypothetical protein [Bacteroides sp.]MDE6215621.1 hypothetical protein [Bacteroides sp.]